MSNKKMKPVWRVNKGIDPKEEVKGVIFTDMEIAINVVPIDSFNYRWDFDETSGDIYAYQTTRTREAKR